jgi:hypothetical protein
VTAARETVWLAALAAVGFALVALATARHGPALFPDSALYLSSAESLREGRGYVLYDGRPYTIAPPLYPTLIASTQRLGIPPATINALAFAGTIFVSGRLLFLSRCRCARRSPAPGRSCSLRSCSARGWPCSPRPSSRAWPEPPRCRSSGSSSPVAGGRCSPRRC